MTLRNWLHSINNVSWFLEVTYERYLVRMRDKQANWMNEFSAVNRMVQRECNSTNSFPYYRTAFA